MTLQTRIQDITGQNVQGLQPLSGGMVGEVKLVTLGDGTQLVAKTATSTEAMLTREGEMLRYLRDHSALPVPKVHHSDATLLLMAYVRGESRFDSTSEQHAADLLAALHRVTRTQFGHDTDTLIGGLHQPNPPTDYWLDFFREQRLLYMAGVARDAGRLPSRVYSRVEALAGKLDRYLNEPTAPALLHGDIWRNNVLAQGGHITAFIDPAIYYGHSEIELAFVALFSTFGRTFFDRYQEHHALEPGFFEERRDLYNLYPLLVHVRLFGGGYLDDVTAILGKFGV